VGAEDPPELEEQLLVEATEDQQPTVDPETGEMREPPEPEIDLEKLKEYEDQIETEDVTRTTSAGSPPRPPAGDPAADPRGRAGHDV